MKTLQKSSLQIFFSNVAKFINDTALMVLSAGHTPDIATHVSKALEVGADVMVCDKEGWTALHFSAFHGQPRSAAVLLAVSHPRTLLETRSTDADAATALELAESEGNEEVAGVIRKAGEEEEGGGRGR